MLYMSFLYWVAVLRSEHTMYVPNGKVSCPPITDVQCSVPLPSMLYSPIIGSMSAVR